MLSNLQELAKIQQREMLDQAEKRRQRLSLRQQEIDLNVDRPRPLVILRRALQWTPKSAESKLNTRTTPAVSTNRT